MGDSRRQNSLAEPNISRRRRKEFKWAAIPTTHSITPSSLENMQSVRHLLKIDSIRVRALPTTVVAHANLTQVISPAPPLQAQPCWPCLFRMPGSRRNGMPVGRAVGPSRLACQAAGTVQSLRSSRHQVHPHARPASRGLDRHSVQRA